MSKIVYIPAILVAMLISLSAYASGAKDKSFRHSFHHAKNVHRFDKSNGFTEYDFMMKGQYVAAFYDASGNLVETDFNIAFKKLPEKVKSFITSEYSNAVITDIEKVEYRQNKCYKIRLESNGTEYVIAANADGEMTIGY